MALNRNMFMNNRQRQAPLVAKHATPPQNTAMTAAKGIGKKVIKDEVVTPMLSSIFAPAATGATAAATGAAGATGALGGLAGSGMMAGLGPAVAAAAPIAVPLLIAASMFGRRK